MRQAELIDQFLQGATSGRASNLKIQQIDQERIGLIGYNTMLYAEYDKSGDNVIVYTDWQKTTPKVEKHIRTIAAQAEGVETEHQTESGTPLVER